MNNLTQIVNEWLRNQKDFNNFFISKSTRTGLWQYDQIMYMDPKHCEVIIDVTKFATAKLPSCDLYMIGFVEEVSVSPWYSDWHDIRAHDPKFFIKLRRFLHRIKDAPQRSYFIRRFYQSAKDVQKGYYSGMWH